MVYDISRRSRNSSSFYRGYAVGSLVFCVIVNLMIYTSLFAALTCELIGLGLLVYGYKSQLRSIFAGGMILMTVGLVQQFYELVYHFDIGGWASLATLGVVAIVAASVMETQGGRIKPQLQDWKTRFQQWEK